MVRNRIQWLDFAKGILILFVILVHFMGYIHFEPFKALMYVLFIFVMPAFFAISGYLYKPSKKLKGYLILLYKKVSSFIIPYLVFTVLYICLHLLTKHYDLIDDLHQLVNNTYHVYLMPIGYLWFLYALFFIFIIVGFMNLIHLDLYVQVLISVTLLISCNYLPWQESSQNNVNPIAGIGEYMICFYIGYLIRKFKLDIHKILSNHTTLPISLVVVWIILIFVQMKITGLNTNMDMFSYDNIITKLLSIPVCFIVFSKFPHNRLFRYFDKYGKDTLAIYMVHFPILIIILKIVSKLPISNPILLFFIYLIPGWYLSIFVCYLVKHFKIINFIFYPRKYINKAMLKTNWGKMLFKN